MTTTATCAGSVRASWATSSTSNEVSTPQTRACTAPAAPPSTVSTRDAARGQASTSSSARSGSTCSIRSSRRDSGQRSLAAEGANLLPSPRQAFHSTHDQCVALLLAPGGFATGPRSKEQRPTQPTTAGTTRTRKRAARSAREESTRPPETRDPRRGTTDSRASRHVRTSKEVATTGRSQASRSAPPAPAIGRSVPPNRSQGGRSVGRRMHSSLWRPPEPHMQLGVVTVCDGVATPNA
jgi:hypothetical protein